MKFCSIGSKISYFEQSNERLILYLESVPGDVDYLETLEREVTHLAHLVQHMFTITTIKLQVNKLQSLQTWQTVKQILHVLQNHASCAKYLDLQKHCKFSKFKIF